MKHNASQHKAVDKARPTPVPSVQTDERAGAGVFDQNDIVMLQRQIGSRAVRQLMAQREKTVPAARNITKSNSSNAQRRIQRNILHSLFRGYARKNIFGKNKDRHKITENTATVKDGNKANFSDVKDINVKSGVHTLAGRHYVGLKENPLDGGKYSGKTVLFLSGSGGSSEDYGIGLAKYYCERGADFVGVNYRGFGGSRYGRNRKLDNSDITEAGMYDDAHAIFDHLQSAMGISAGDVIVHGFSLGGPVAAELVNHLAGIGVRVGGLVLHSPMDSVKRQAVASAGAGPGGFAADASGVVLDLRQHLLALSQQPGFTDLAIHFMSGKAENEDQLDVAHTGVSIDAAKMGFSNMTSTRSNAGDHTDVDEHIKVAGRGANTRDESALSLDRLFAQPVDVSGVQSVDPSPVIQIIVSELTASVSDEIIPIVEAEKQEHEAEEAG